MEGQLFEGTNELDVGKERTIMGAKTERKCKVSKEGRKEGRNIGKNKGKREQSRAGRQELNIRGQQMRFTFYRTYCCVASIILTVYYTNTSQLKMYMT